MRTHFLAGALTGAALLAGGLTMGAATLYVSPAGRDGWSGQFSSPTVSGRDGPLATLAGARDAVRRHRGLHPDEPITVLFREGVYVLDEPVEFVSADSGTRSAPVRYAAYAGEMPVLQGGEAIAGWHREASGVYSVLLSSVTSGKACFRQLFADGRRQTRARCPNVDSADPLRRGFFYCAADTGGFGCTVGCIHNRGDWMKYEVEIPADGDYAFWMRYGANNRQTEWETADMATRTVLIVDNREPVPLVDLPDTGGWSPVRWSKSAIVPLARGRHTLVWKNVLGGGINIDAYALCDDPSWRAEGTALAEPAAGRHLVVIQAEKMVASEGKQLRVSVSGGARDRFHYRVEDFKPEWAAVPNAEVHIFQSGSCRAFKEILGIAAIDTEALVVHVSGPETKAGLRAGDRYFVENLPDELDAPGEWHLDTASGELRFLPDRSVESMEVVVPATCELVRLIGEPDGGPPVQFLSFSGFTIRYTGMTLQDGCAGYGMGTEGVFRWEHTADCRIEHCTFENCGRYAVAIVSGTRNEIAGCAIRDSAQGGVLIIDSDHCRVVYNIIERLGAIYKHIGGVVLTGRKASDNLVAHNLIRDSSRYGITCKNAGLRNVIASNALYRMSTETYDTGGIEVTQHVRDELSMSIIRNNLVVDVIGYSSSFETPQYLSWGIYLDSFAGGYTVEDNVTVRSSHGVMIQGGRGNALRNNVFVGGATAQFIFANYASNSADNEFTRNIVYWEDAKAAMGRLGREVETTLSADRNLFFCASRELVGTDEYDTWRERGFDEHGVVADPLFTDPANGDYSLCPESPAYALGFRRIDLSDVGPRLGSEPGAASAER